MFSKNTILSDLFFSLPRVCCFVWHLSNSIICLSGILYIVNDSLCSIFHIVSFEAVLWFFILCCHCHLPLSTVLLSVVSFILLLLPSSGFFLLKIFLKKLCILIYSYFFCIVLPYFSSLFFYLVFYMHSRLFFPQYRENNDIFIRLEL